MLIVSIDEKEALTLYQSWWRHPDIMGIEKGSEEYIRLQKMWEEATGRKIEEDEDDSAEQPKRKLTRDKVISVVNGRALVGVYWEGSDGSEVLFECSPKRADRIIAIFNEEVDSNEGHEREG